MAEIELKNLTKRWGNFVGVDNFNLTIPDEEFLVLLGPSGCGKTTTMRMIAGLENVTNGEVLIDGKVVNTLEPKDRDVAMVFQSYALYPNMTVYENIRFPLKVRKIDKSLHDERVMRASEMVELNDFLHRKPAELSGGQRQRVALARAIVREPTVFLMDEPLSNLDAKLRVSTRAQIKNLQHSLKVTTIYVTHDQVEAMTLADKIVVLKDGSVEQSGSPMELYKNPDNRFVAGFIGSPSTNFFRAEINNKNLIIPALGNKIVPVNIDANKAKTSLEVGIRPQNLEVHPDAHSELYIEFRERLGGVSYDYLKTPTGESLTVETKSDDEIKPGTKVSVGFKESDVLIFDRATGHRVR